MIESVEDAQRVQIQDPSHVAVLTQTTLSVDDTKDILEELKSRFPHIQAPSKSDICYATTNRQAAIKEICKEVDLVLVVGSRTSSNSNRLREVAERAGVRSYLISDETEIKPDWLVGVQSIGMTAGASTPEVIIMNCISKLQSLGVSEVEERPLIEESVIFNLPKMK